LIAFQFTVLFMNQNSVHKVFVRSQGWYQQDAAERIANLTSTTLEMLLESKSTRKAFSETEMRKIIQDFNIIFSQQLLDKNVQAICILIPRDSSVIAIDDGEQLFDYFFGDPQKVKGSNELHADAIRLFQQIRDTLQRSEQTYTYLEQQRIFHVFVPFVPHGEFVGAEYMRATPDLSFLTEEMTSNYDQTALVYSGLIIAGLIAILYLSARTLRERNRAQHLLFEEQKRHLTDQINIQKEMHFTKRIYHTHHKAEKIGGFIKEDLREMTPGNMAVVKERINKYASFIARVIYDMKWYDPPVQTIRGPMFRTNMNDVIRFIVDNIFKRVTDNRGEVEFVLALDPALQPVAINEYAFWEVIEPIIQNSLDHANVENNVITIKTTFFPDRHESTIVVSDIGKGMRPDLLEYDQRGVRKIFGEHMTSGGSNGKEHTGYGCYIAYELATQRFGWQLDAENLRGGGAQFTFTVPHRG
jgi:signal transduction histidine kinase